MFLYEVDHFQTGVEEAVNTVVQTRLFAPREPCCRRTGDAFVPTHASHFVDGVLDADVCLFLFDERRELSLGRVVEPGVVHDGR